MTQTAKANLHARLDQLEAGLERARLHVERHGEAGPDLITQANDFSARLAQLRARIDAEDGDEEIELVTPDTGPFAEVDNLEEGLAAFVKTIDDEFNARPDRIRSAGGL